MLGTAEGGADADPFGVARGHDRLRLVVLHLEGRVAQRAAQDLALQQGDGGAVTVDDELAHIGRQVLVHVRDDDLVTLLHGDVAREREGLVEHAARQVDRVAQRGAAQHGVAPQTVDGQVVALAGFQAEFGRVAQAGEQVADQLDLLRGLDFGLGIVEHRAGDAGLMQQGFQRGTFVEAQLDEDAGGGDTTAEIPRRQLVTGGHVLPCLARRSWISRGEAPGTASIHYVRKQKRGVRIRVLNR